MRARLTAAALAVAAILASCGSNPTPPAAETPTSVTAAAPTTNTPTSAPTSAQQHADDIAAAFYADHAAILDAMFVLFGQDPTRKDRFDWSECAYVTRPVTSEEATAWALYLHDTFEQGDTDLAEFVAATNQYRADIAATGVCER